MKKAMFGLACAAAMVACADIESANIVGYNNKNTPANYSLALPMFNAVGSSGLSLSDIIPEGENVNGNGDITLQTFTDMASADQVYLWLTEDDMGVTEGDGWYLDDLETRAEKTFAPGEGFMCGAMSGEITLRFAGEVDLTAKSIDCRENYSLLGNFRPLPVDINDIVPSGDNVNGNGDITLQTFTDMANSDQIYLWLTEDDMGVTEGDGWYLDDLETRAEKTFAPGEGFMLGAMSGTIKLNFPAVNL